MRIIVFFAFIMFSLNMKGSDTTSFNLRKNIYFTISMDEFLPPMYGKTKNIDNSIHINYDEREQITGPKIKFGFGFKLFHERLFLRHSISLKYGHLYYETTVPDSSAAGLLAFNKSIRKITFDQNIDISYPFSFKGFWVSPILGFSWINMHSEYFYVSPSGWYYNGDFLMNGFYFGVSLTKNLIDLSLNLHCIGKENTRYKEVRNIFIPSISISYNINKNL